jgi:SSS family solute:Na+ symporter
MCSVFLQPLILSRQDGPGLEGEETKQTFIVLLNNLLPSGLRGLVLASLLAALITSLIAVLNSVSTLVVRDFVVKAKPDMKESTQVLLGRAVILIVTLLGIGAAYLVYKNEEGLYKYLQTITAYLILPVFPAIFFGIISKKVTLKAATVSVALGLIFSTIFVIDQFIGAEAGERIFPFLHYKLTLNFGYRGLWATLLITGILFAVSAFTPKTDPAKLEKTTISYSKKIAPFSGLSDWRLHLLILAGITILIYSWLR